MVKSMILDDRPVPTRSSPRRGRAARRRISAAGAAVTAAALGVALAVTPASSAAAQSSTAGRPSSATNSADAVRTDIELQARANLLANDNGWNLPPGTQFNSISPDLNSRGQVAFSAQLVPYEADPNAFGGGIWLGGHGTGGLVHRTPVDNQVNPDPSVNEAGDIAFTVATGGVDNTLWRYDAGTGSASRLGTAPVLPNSYSSPRIDEAGDIGFQASFASGRAYAAVRGGAGTFQVKDNGLDPASPYTYLYTPRFNDAGQVAAKVATSGDLTSAVEVRRFEPDGSSTRILANKGTDPASPYRTFNNSVALSDDGEVAVVATRDSDGRRVLVRSDGTTTTEIAVATPDGTIRELEYFTPAINNAGEVAFRAKDAAGQAIYVGDGSTLRRVAAQGDVVQTDLGVGQLGQHDTSPVFGGSPAINATGDVAFTAGLHPEGDRMVEWGSGVFVAYAQERNPEPPAEGSVIGTITDANDERPVAAATVTLTGEDGATRTGQSGSDGTFRIAVAPGSYDATVSAPDYAPFSTTVTVTKDQPTTLDAALKTAVISLDPASLNLEVTEGDSTSATVTLKNTGSAELSWRASGPSWLKTAPTEGTLAVGASATLALTVDAAGLSVGTHSGALAVSGNAGRAGKVQVPVEVTVAAARAPFVAAVNVGGDEYTDAHGTTWAADQAWTDGSWGFLGAKTKAESTKKDITGTEADDLYQTLRSGLDGYRFDDVPAGTYEVTLGFAELQKNPKPDNRKMNVRIGASYLLVWHDVAKEVGGLTADEHTFTVRHDGGPLVITLEAQKPGTMLNLVKLVEQR